MINCIAIDDEPLALEIIESFCAKIPFIQLQKTFTDPSEAAKYLRKFPVDLLILDIQMPDMNGIDFYKKYGDNKLVIFSTAYSEYAVQGFTLSAVDYLLKPVDFLRFKQAVTKAQEYFQFLHGSEEKEKRFLLVRSEYSLVKIPFEEIEYIETLDDYLKIHLRGKKTILTKMNLKNMMTKLDHKEFVRVHRSFIVAINSIHSVRNKVIKLENTEIPIGTKFEIEFFSLYKQG